MTEPKPLEGPDDPISLIRAAEIAGLEDSTLRHAANDGRLQTRKLARDWWTTRRWLHSYLVGRSRGVVPPLPPTYVAPDEDNDKPVEE